MFQDEEKFIPISKKADEIDWERIKLFRRRFNTLWLNLQDLDLEVLNGNFGKTNNGSYRGGFNLPSQFRLKSLYVDYRHFYLNDEPTNINRFCNYLASLTESYEYKIFIKDEKKNLKSDFIENGWFNVNEKNITTKKLLDTWFNAELFHSDPLKISELLAWQDVFDNETSKSMLFMSVFNSINVIKNINWSSALLKSNNLYLRVPNSIK